jgi:cyclophilin family peptidyl-prolyl cis-trans isomerase
MREGWERTSSVFATIAIVAVAATSAGCGGQSEASKIAEEAGCESVSAPEPRDTTLPAPKQTVKPGEKLTATVKTSCGTFEIALDTKTAPKTTNSFAYLAREGFYDGLDFNRIVPGLLVQGGDPTGDGTGNGTGNAGYTITEPPPADTKYTKGVVAMAREFKEPSGQSGSQFFVVTSLEAGYPPEYALVGEVSKGYPVVKRISELNGEEEEPKIPVLIEEVTIEKG